MPKIVTYKINFTSDSGGPVPTGSFKYDQSKASLANDGKLLEGQWVPAFSDFKVVFEGVTSDLTDSANKLQFNVEPDLFNQIVAGNPLRAFLTEQSPPQNIFNRYVSFFPPSRTLALLAGEFDGTPGYPVYWLGTKKDGIFWMGTGQPDYRAHYTRLGNYGALGINGNVIIEEKDRKLPNMFTGKWSITAESYEELPDPRKSKAYSEIAGSVNKIFDPIEATKYDLEVRLAAAEDLAREGLDTRMKLPKDSDYWAKIPEGSFTIGAQDQNPNALAYDKDSGSMNMPAIEPKIVEVPEFWIGKFPVTVYEYQQYLLSLYPSEAIAKKFTPDYQKTISWDEQLRIPSRPMVGITWQEATDYCQWAGGFLPTSAQWEFVAKGPGSDPCRYPWGDVAPTIEHANWVETGIYFPTPVGLFPLGDVIVGDQRISDLTGNVEEWSSDPPYYSNPVLRGGGYGLPAITLRNWFRNDDGIGSRSPDYGFRCVRNTPPT